MDGQTIEQLQSDNEHLVQLIERCRAHQEMMMSQYLVQLERLFAVCGTWQATCEAVTARWQSAMEDRMPKSHAWILQGIAFIGGMLAMSILGAH